MRTKSSNPRAAPPATSSHAPSPPPRSPTPQLVQARPPLPLDGQSARTENLPGPTSGFDAEAAAADILQKFFSRLPDIRALVATDVRATYEGDPAALSFAEVILAYPGLLAIAAHRLAHELYALQVPILPRIMSEWIHTQTGTDIHPGAQIGPAFFIDHATGVVIGETAEFCQAMDAYRATL